MLRQFSNSDILPDRVILYAQKGWGKTTFASLSPNPIILMSHNETGYLTLRGNSLVPDAPFDVINSWSALESQLRDLLAKGAGDRKTLVLDALGGFERLCHEHVCSQKYGGDWGEKGFTGYMRGYAVSVPEFDRMLSLLDEVRIKLGLRIIILAHARVKDMPNPLGPDFKQYLADCHDKTWECFKRWADIVLFGKHRTQVAKIEGENKGVGGDDRVLYCSHTDAFEAGNRHGLPAEIAMPKKPGEMWNEFAKRLPKAASAAAAAQPSTAPTNAPASSGAKSDSLLMELQMLVAFHKIEGSVPKWCDHFKVTGLDKLTDAQLTSIIDKIKSSKKAA